MVTHERELTGPVDLCVEGTDRLDPAARGWSRRPLHRANLPTRDGVNKRWDYWAVLAGDLVVSAVYSDVDHFGLADVWWADLVERRAGWPRDRRPRRRPAWRSRSGRERHRWWSTATDWRCASPTTTTDTRLAATWTERDGRPGALDVAVALPAGSRVAERRDPVERRARSTSPRSTRPARRAATLHRGRPRVDDRCARRTTPGVCSTSAGAAGRPRSRGTGAVVPAGPATTWSACSSAPSGPRGRASPRTASSSTGGSRSSAPSSTGTTTGTSRCTPWRVVDPGGQLDVELTPRFDKHTTARGPEARQRDAPGVRHLVGSGAHRRRGRARVRRPAGLRRGGPPALVIWQCCRMSAHLERFAANADPDAVCAALDRDGARHRRGPAVGRRRRRA